MGKVGVGNFVDDFCSVDLRWSLWIIRKNNSIIVQFISEGFVTLTLSNKLLQQNYQMKKKIHPN